MREIKFRAWDGKNMVVSGFYIHPDTGLCEFPESGWDLQGYTENPDEFKLMQFTGLTDRNGVEIYEGDIVHVWLDDSDWITEVSFSEGAFSVLLYDTVLQGSYEPCLYELNVIEVIGNIYESPDLLDQQSGGE